MSNPFQQSTPAAPPAASAPTMTAPNPLAQAPAQPAQFAAPGAAEQPPQWQPAVAQAAAPTMAAPAFAPPPAAPAPPAFAAPAGPAQFAPNFGGPAQPQQAFGASPVSAPALPAAAPEQVTFSAPTSAIGGPADDGDPFADPTGPGSGLRMRDVLGMLMIVKPTEHIPHIKTSKSEGEAVRGDVVLLDHPQQPGAVAKNTMFFQRALVRDLKNIQSSGKRYLLGRLTMGNASNGNNAPYIFAPASDQDKALARQWLAVNQL